MNRSPQSNKLQDCLRNSCSGAIPKRSLERQNDNSLELVRCNTRHRKCVIINCSKRFYTAISLVLNTSLFNIAQNPVIAHGSSGVHHPVNKVDQRIEVDKDMVNKTSDLESSKGK